MSLAGQCLLRRITRIVVMTSLVSLLSSCGAESAPSDSPADTPAPAPSTPTTPATPSPATTPATTVDEETLELAGALAQIWGHLEASAASIEAGNWDFAAAHAGHPVAEYWEQVEGPLAEQGLAQPLREALDRYVQAVEDQASDYQNAHQAAVSETREALEAVAGASWDDPAFRAELIRHLLETVEHEYSEAVEGGQLAELVEYQDAWGFFTVARQLYTDIARQVQAGSSEAAEEIEHELAELDRVFGTFIVQPGQVPAAPEEVNEAVGEVRAELAKALQLATAEPKGPAETIAEIKALIQQALDAYARGEQDQAYDLAADAYLEGFETIEGDLIQRGEREFVEEVEIQFKELRDGIRQGRPPEELQALVDEISGKLDHALEVLQ